MKRTLSAYRSWFMAVGLAVAIVGTTRWLPDHDGRRGDYGLAGAAAQRGDTDLDAAAERPARRLRASSTMPYFSFAQSLRSRG
ncbi:hypothetical protein [Pseudoxanthomonas suwonensis]|uniref:Uncharacterized protein n=1 Tax=Pseudoxanthomonas suwonensis TaxID=314722 RepID=A0A0E3UPG0_9GAMM|nr:hypothetical protein [Pseudoxanthomonas suwonensis]AKC87795.1 hypothetical protein WQ53_14540 [Pseudoxanthomonas suwonensis]